MVQAFTLAIAALAAVAPVLAAPTHRAVHAHTEHPEARALDITSDELLDARDPFSFKNAFRKIGRVAKRVGGIAMKAAPLLLRDVDLEYELDAREFDEGPVGEIYIRDADGFLYVRELDAEELGVALEARKFNLKRVLKKGMSAARKGMGIAQKVSGVAGQFGLRELDELEEREFEESLLDELD